MQVICSHLLTLLLFILFNLFLGDYDWLHLIHLIQLIQLLLSAGYCDSGLSGNLHQLGMLLAAIPENP